MVLVYPRALTLFLFAAHLPAETLYVYFRYARCARGLGSPTFSEGQDAPQSLSALRALCAWRDELLHCKRRADARVWRRRW